MVESFHFSYQPQAWLLRNLHVGFKLSAANMISNINDMQVFNIPNLAWMQLDHSPSLCHKPSRHGPGSLMFAHRSIHTHPFCHSSCLNYHKTVGTNVKKTCLLQVIGVVGAPPFPSADQKDSQ